MERSVGRREDGVRVGGVRPGAGPVGGSGPAHETGTGSLRSVPQTCPGYDGGDGRRQWRALDLGTVKAVLEADAPRVSCRRHGVVVAAVPWARHGAGHTYAFDDTVAWLTVRCSKTAVRELMRVAWRTVGSIITRVSADAMAGDRPVREPVPDRDR